MRLRRLDLTRYGRFTGTRLDFGPPPEGPDLHLVYGPNEAGKSTALAGFLDLLFGIPHQSPYAFLHPYDSMEVGAVLEGAGADGAWTRVKARRNSLRDGRGQPVGEHALGAALGGLDRDSYTTMFSLDDDTLESGGEDILKSRGDLGQLLFSASAGLSGLSRSLEAMGAEAERFTKKGGKRTELAESKRALEALEARRREIDTQAADYARLVREAERAQAAYEAAQGERAEAAARLKTVERLRAGQGRAAALARLRAELAPLADLPEPPPGWADAIGPLMAEETRLETERAGLDRRIAALADELAQLDVDDAVLAVAHRVERLADPEARHRTAARDLPTRRVERREIDTVVAGILGRLDRSGTTEARGLLLPVATTGTLRDLIEARSGIAERLEAATREADRARDRLTEAQAGLARVQGPAGTDAADDVDHTEDATAWRVLGDVVRRLRGDDAATRRRLVRRERDRLVPVLADALEALLPWHGEAEALAAQAVPDAARLEAWRTALATAGEEAATQAREVARLEDERARLAAERGALQAEGGVIDDAAAAAQRAARDAAWQRHRAALDAGTAETFAAVMEEHDRLTDGRLARATDVARLREVQRALAATEAALERGRAAQATSDARVRAVRETVAETLAALGLPTAWPLESLTDWLGRRARALEARAALRDAEQALADAAEDDRRAQCVLAQALAAVGVPQPPEADLARLLETAEAALERRRERDERRRAAVEAVRTAGRELTDRSRDRDAAAAAEAAWRRQWADALDGCWLAGRDAPPAPGAVRQALDELASLSAALEKRDSLDQRIAAMEADQRHYVEALAAVLADLGESPDRDRPLETADGLRGRLQAAREAAAARARGQDERARVRAQHDDLADRARAHAARAAEMMAFFGVGTLAEVAAALQRVAQRTALRARVAEAERALVEALATASPEEAEAALAAADAEALGREEADLTARLADLEPRVRELYAAWTRARDALAAVDGDDAAARLEAERRTLLLDIADRAERHLRLRLGIAAATQALSLYRERHRSAMLARAAEAFAVISRGAYTGLSTRPEADEEKLIALEAGGGSKVVSALSKGTRFQLYLALRVAGYHEFAARRAPVPFIADDIMETFDDFRAEEAFRLFAGMAGAGQVIYLSHHRHLCDIARTVCPTVTVHTLDGP